MRRIIVLKKVINRAKEIIKSADKKILTPIIKWIISLLSKKIKNQVQDSTSPVEWKTKALEDFKLWLADIEEPDFSVDSASPDSCDLYTLLSEFSALRQEIKMQNREQNKSIRSISKLSETYQQSFEQALELFKENIKDVTSLEDKIRLNCEKKVVMPFLDIRDALVRGHISTLDISKSQGFFRRAPKGIESITQGYEMALRRFDRAIGAIDIICIKTVGQPFDPKTMKALDTKSVHEDQKGLVVEERLSGFMRNHEVLRTAEVIVGDCR